MAQGTASRRFFWTSSPQASHTPKPPLSSRFRACSRHAGTTESAGAPGLKPLCTSQVPFCVCTRSRASTSAPHDRANPIAAAVGFPSPSNAASSDGPRRSTVLSGCRVATSAIQTARRRGVANHRNEQPSGASCSLLRADAHPAAKPSPRVRSAVGGRSSVPISISKLSDGISATCACTRLPLREAELLSVPVIPLRNRLRQRPYPSDVAGPLGHADGMPRIQ